VSTSIIILITFNLIQLDSTWSPSVSTRPTDRHQRSPSTYVGDSAGEKSRFCTPSIVWYLYTLGQFALTILYPLWLDNTRFINDWQDGGWNLWSVFRNNFIFVIDWLAGAVAVGSAVLSCALCRADDFHHQTQPAGTSDHSLHHIPWLDILFRVYQWVGRRKLQVVLHAAVLWQSRHVHIAPLLHSTPPQLPLLHRELDVHLSADNDQTETSEDSIRN